MDMRKLVGRNVKRIRQEKDLTQEQLAELSGFSQRYNSGLEQGRRNPTIVGIYKLATALGLATRSSCALPLKNSVLTDCQTKRLGKLGRPLP
jgi:transcriptional regulator with XRE-family HTH domain